MRRGEAPDVDVAYWRGCDQEGNAAEVKGSGGREQLHHINSVITDMSTLNVSGGLYFFARK